ncbi:MAG: hypothetical protein DRP61_02140 [Candidatus Omnitrophota bacterium]|nr:MAG: hypothetical protein DRP61_02140 [Candidatus Omnitrophota bacterium]RKY43099.1 MAG: hypothetical protein DRP80_06010 [Candidatus Omnitrophota bacterium]
MISFSAISNFFSKLSKRERLIFYLTIFFVFLFLVDKLVIEPLLSKMKTQEEEIKEKRMLIKKDLHILSIKDRILEESKKYEKFFSKTKSLDEEVTLILKEIESLANKSSVYLIFIRPGEVREEGSFKELLINLNCEGEMSQIVDFLYSIENSPKLLTIERYVISPKSEGSSLAQCRMIISKIVIPFSG